MKIAIEDIKKLVSERAKINKMPLEDIEFYENGIKLEIPQGVVDGFGFTGLNTLDFIIDFITSGAYKNPPITTRFGECSVDGCNNFAIKLCRPVKEVPPKTGSVWKNYAPAGPMKGFCEIHKNEADTYANIKRK